MKRRTFLRRTTAALAGAAVAPPIGRLSARRTERYVERWSWAMGQAVRVQLFAPSEDLGLEAAAAVLRELRRVEAQLSIFDDASDLSELNRHAGRGWFGAGDDLLTFLRAAERMRRLTSGAFDPAVEPLMRAWGFREMARATPPTPAVLREAGDAVRAARIVVDGRRVALPAGHTRLDPGGIGVGYGLDRARAVLRRYQIQRAFIDVSGDCLARGAPPGENGWPVTVVDSARPSRVIVSTRLRDLALATSSNAVSVVRFGDLTVGHIMDPRSDGPARALSQATVVARTGIEADALSTALLVSGRPGPGALEVWRG